MISGKKSGDLQDDTDDGDYTYEEHCDAHDLCCDESCNTQEDSDSENDENVGSKPKRLKQLQRAGRKPGRKAKWNDSLINDMVDIIINNENYKRKLLFINMKNKKNGDIYAKVLEKMKKRAAEREEPVPFSVPQLCTKFKKIVGECKNAALTIKTGTGIKGFQDNKGFGNWFNPLFALIKTRDACKPELAIEPSALSSESVGVDSDDHSTATSSTSQEGGGRKLFVPVKRSRKKEKKNPIEEATTLLKEAIEKDPVKDLLVFMREEAEKSRQHDLMLLQMQSMQHPVPLQSFVQPASQSVQMMGNQVPVVQHQQHGPFNAGISSTFSQGQCQYMSQENNPRYHSL